MRFRVLGPMTVEMNGDQARLGGPKQRGVLAMLVVAVGRPVTIERIIDGVWGESPPKAVRASVHSYVSNLRVALGGGIQQRGGSYRLEAEPNDIDAIEFERLADEGHRLLSTNPQAASTRLREALALWRGRPYADLVDVPGIELEARRLEDRRIGTVEARIDADLANGRHGAVIGELEALTTEYPLHEGFRSRQMLALYRDGRQAEALRLYQKTRGVLVAELGIDPSPDLQALEHRILTHDPNLLRATDAAAQRVAFLAAEASVAAELWDVRPDDAREALTVFDDAIKDAVDAAGGRLFRQSGTTLLAAFADVPSVARAALNLHTRLAGAEPRLVDVLEVRIAIDEGEVEVSAGDFHGPPVLRALRFMAAGHGGQMLLTQAARDGLGTEAGVQILNLGEHRFGGLGAPVPVYQLVADGMERRFPDLRTEAATIDLGRQPGDAIRGYELRERIGSGRFGVVYRAYQPSVGREVALKLIRPEFADHPEFIRRFESEARLVAKLEHPHIVTLLDFWRDHEGAYFVMPYMAGGSLAGATGEELSPSRVLGILRQVGSALQYAHREGVIHRDIKPANILLDSDGNAYLADFGVAMPAVKRASEMRASSPAYRAPEDRAGHAVDGRSDVYSLGAVATKLLTGDFAGPTSIGTVPGPLRDVLRRALAEQPHDRFAFVGGFVDALGTALDASVEPSAAAVVGMRNPFKGLAAFDVADARDFYGRDAEIRQLVDLVRQRGFVTVVGPSGSGKSSLVRAGLIPVVTDHKSAEPPVWTSVVMTPGSDPFAALAAELSSVATAPGHDVLAKLVDGDKGLAQALAEVGRNAHGDLLLVIDQFEELYSLAEDTTRRAFIDTLTSAVDDPQCPLRVVITVRADFFDRPLADDRLSLRVQDALLAIGTPSPAALTEAIVRPAEAAGVRLEPGLVARIVADVREQPGALPLMQFVLTSLVDASDDGSVSVDSYEQLGGVTGAVGCSADAIYQRLDPAAQALAQQVFLRLVTVTDEADDVRRRVRLSELRDLGMTVAVLDAVLDAYGEARLLTFDHDPTSRAPTVEVAHEALVREWPQLRGWIEEQRDSLVTRRRMRAAIHEWEAGGLVDDLLPAGRRLAQFETWAEEPATHLTANERNFIAKAIARRDRQQRAAVRRRRTVMAGFAAAALVATVLAVAAWAQRNTAAREASLAEARELILEAEKNVDIDPDLALHLALSAVEAFELAGDAPPPSAVNVLRAAVATQRTEARIEAGIGVSINASGTAFALRGPDGEILLHDATSLAEVESLTVAGADILDFWFSTGVDELYVAAGYEDGRVALLARTGSAAGWTTIVERLPEPDGPVWVELSSDGNVLVINSNGELTARDRSTGELLYSRSMLPDAPMLTVASKLAFADVLEDGSPLIRVLNVRTGDELQAVSGLEFLPSDLSASASGDRIVAVERNGIAALVDLNTEQIVWTRTDLTRARRALWLPHDRLLIGGELQLRVLDAQTGDTVRRVPGASGATFHYVVLPGTESVVATGDGDDAVVIDLSDTHGGEVGMWQLDREAVVDLQVDDDGEHIYIDSWPTGLAVADIDTGELMLEVPSGEADGLPNYWDTPMRTNNVDYVSGSDLDARYRLRFAATGDVVYTAPEGFAIVGMSEDASLAVIHRENQSTQVVRTGDGTVVVTLDAGPSVIGAHFASDGRSLLTNTQGAEPMLRIFDVATGERPGEFGTFQGINAGWDTEVTPDGSKLVIGGYDGVVRVVDYEAMAAGVPEEEALLSEFPAHDDFIIRVAVSPDGSMVATTAWEEPAKLWDLETGRPLGEFGLTAPNAVAFHPTEPWVYVFDAGVVRIHTLDVDELVEIAQSRITRPITEEECQQYFGRPCAAS